MSAKPKMLTIGAAVQDVFLSGKALTPTLEDGEWVEELKMGEKFDVDKIVFSTGGGATNAATTFARQGLESEFIGVVGDDPVGQAVIADLKKEGIAYDKVGTSKKFNTGYSVLLLSPKGERVILTYRGASTHYSRDEFDLDEAKADWIYLSTLTGNFELLDYILTVAEETGAKVAMDPGKLELANPEKFKEFIPRLTILKGNRDELGKLTKSEDSKSIVLELGKTIKNVIVTDGPVGSVATDGKVLIEAGMYKDVPVVDRTGAGDAFGSGFVAALAMGKDLFE